VVARVSVESAKQQPREVRAREEVHGGTQRLLHLPLQFRRQRVCFRARERAPDRDLAHVRGVKEKVHEAKQEARREQQLGRPDGEP
jgi:hypothetical protein